MSEEVACRRASQQDAGAFEAEAILMHSAPCKQNSHTACCMPPWPGFIVAANKRMALETEGLHLDDNKLSSGVQAVLNGGASALYYLVEQGGQVSQAATGRNVAEEFMRQPRSHSNCS